VEDDFIGVWVCFSSRLVCGDAPAPFSVPHHFLLFHYTYILGKDHHRVDSRAAIGKSRFWALSG